MASNRENKTKMVVGSNSNSDSDSNSNSNSNRITLLWGDGTRTCGITNMAAADTDADASSDDSAMAPVASKRIGTARSRKRKGTHIEEKKKEGARINATTASALASASVDKPVVRLPVVLYSTTTKTASTTKTATTTMIPLYPPCTGLTIEYVLKSRYNNEKKKNDAVKLKNGFCHLIGTAMVQNGMYVSQQKQPPHPYFNDPSVVGVVKMNIDATKVDYVCKKRQTTALNNNVEDNDGDGDGDGTFSYVSLYTFYSNGCTKTTQTKGTSVCTSCANKKDCFKRRLLGEFELREGPLNPHMANARIMFSPDLLVEKIKHQRKLIQTISTKKSNEKQRMDKVLELSTIRLRYQANEKEEVKKCLRRERKTMRERELSQRQDTTAATTTATTTTNATNSSFPSFKQQHPQQYPHPPPPPTQQDVIFRLDGSGSGLCNALMPLLYSSVRKYTFLIATTTNDDDIPPNKKEMIDDLMNDIVTRKNFGRFLKQQIEKRCSISGQDGSGNCHDDDDNNNNRYEWWGELTVEEARLEIVRIVTELLDKDGEGLVQIHKQKLQEQEQAQ